MLHVIDQEPKKLMPQEPLGHADSGKVAIDAICEMSILIDESMTKYFDMEVLTHEARLVLQLLRKQNLIIKDAWLSSRLSNRAFHELLKRMEGNGIIRVAPSLIDRRTKSIALTADFVAHALPKLRWLGEARAQRQSTEPET